MYKIMLIALVLPFFFGCSREYTPPPQEDEELPVVLGEISPNKENSIILTTAKNITYSDNHVSNDFSSVVLLDKLGNKLDDFILFENESWKTNYHVKSNTEYTLQFKYNTREIKTTAIIPSDFHAKIIENKSLSKDTVQIKLALEDIAEKSFFVIECWQTNRDNHSKLYFLNKDSFTDNNKFGELSSPFNRLFVKTSYNQEVTLKIIRDGYYYPSEDQFTEIRIKSVAPNYYDYLYNYELQLQGEEIFLPKNSEYLGIWGGCNVLNFRI